MDPIVLVENQIENGQHLINALCAAHIRLNLVFWMRRFEQERWTLHIVTPLVEEKGLTAAYGVVLRILRDLPGMSISGSDVKLIGENEKIAPKKLIAIQKQFSGHVTARLQEEIFGDEGIYVYPLGTVEITVYGMIFRGEPGGVLHLSLEPHNPNGRLIIENAGRSDVFPAETGLDFVVAAPEGARLERNKIGLMVLKWDLYGKPQESSANEVWTLAHLGYHGFRFVRKPGMNQSEPKELVKAG